MIHPDVTAVFLPAAARQGLYPPPSWARENHSFVELYYQAVAEGPDRILLAPGVRPAELAVSLSAAIREPEESGWAVRIAPLRLPYAANLIGLLAETRPDMAASYLMGEWGIDPGPVVGHLYRTGKLRSFLFAVIQRGAAAALKASTEYADEEDMRDDDKRPE